MTRDTKWYFTLDQEKKNWKVFRSDKPAMTGNKVLGSVTNIHGSKSNPSILKVTFDNHENGISLRRDYFEWSRNELSRKFESSRISNEAFVAKFRELFSSEVMVATVAALLDTNNKTPEPISDEPSPAFGQESSPPPFQFTSTPITTKPQQSLTKKRLKPTLKMNVSEKKRKIDNDEKEMEEDKKFLQRLIKQKKKIDGQFSILTENLASPRSNYLLRSPDDQYVKNLKVELLRRPIPFGAPFLCIVKGIPDADQFDNYKLDGYVYETIGGNHRRLALQQILRDEGVQDVEKEKFKCVNVQLYAELPDVDVLRLACLHNKQDEMHADLCGQDKVQLCRQQKIVCGENSSKWRRQCSLILGESDTSLEYTFALANLECDAYAELLDFFENFENINVKGQRAPVKVLGLQTKPNFRASAFRNLRGLPTDVVTELLRLVNTKEYSIKELESEATSLKQMRNVQEALLDTLGEDDWDTVVSSYPRFVTPEALEPYKGTIKRGHITPEFNQFVQNMKNGQNEGSFLLDTMCLSASELHHESVQDKLTGFTGIGMVLLDLPENWDQVSISKFIRQMRAINIRKGKTEFGIWIFFKEAGNEKKFGQIASVIEAAKSNSLNCRIGHTGCIREKSTHHMTSTILEMAILSPSEEILDTFGKTFLFESSHRPTELFEETFKSVDKQSLVLCVNLQDCKTVWKALQDKANIIFVCEEKEKEITLRKQLLLEVDEKAIAEKKSSGKDDDSFSDHDVRNALGALSSL